MTTTPDAYITELRQAVTLAGLNYEIWWAYKSKDTRPQFVDVMNRYTIFFQASLHAHFVALLVSLYRLYETRADTYNIPAFIELLETNAALSSDVIQSIRSKYELAKPLWIKVSILRNKVFGHRSLALTVEEAFAEAKVTPDELKALMDITKSLLNELANRLDRSTHAFNLGAGDDVLRLLADLQRTEKATNKMTTATPQEILEHLGYEWWMFREACEMLRCAGDEHNAERNVVVEAVMIHGRALIEFFCHDKSSNQKFHDTDWRVTDFEMELFGKEQELEAWYEFTGWYVAHLTEKRLPELSLDRLSITAVRERLQGCIDAVKDVRGVTIPTDWIGDRQIRLRCPDLGIEYSGGATGLSGPV